MNLETENTEFQSQLTEELCKEVIAFANTDGGIIFFNHSSKDTFQDKLLKAIRSEKTE